MNTKFRSICMSAALFLFLAWALPAAAMNKAEADLEVQQARISLLQFTSSPDTSTPAGSWPAARGWPCSRA